MKKRTSLNRVSWIVLVISLAYFLLLCLPNAYGARDEGTLLATSVDEPVTYAVLTHMFRPADSLKSAVMHWVIYGDYHYGFIFYFFSGLVLLSVQWITGNLQSQTALNLWILRQMVSVLPMLLAILILVSKQTGFNSLRLTLPLLFVMLTMPAVLRNNIQWWHPDALSIFTVVLTLVFLDRDKFQFNLFFFLAAAACGLAVGIKLAGIFFVITIPAYLVVGWLYHRIRFGKMLLFGLVFVMIMSAVAILSNPFVFIPAERQKLVDIQLYKTQELDQGNGKMNIDDAKSPSAWNWTLNTWFGHPLFLAFVFLSLIIGCIWGSNRIFNLLILSYALPYAIFLLFFVAVKPDHYWLPIMIPAFSSLLSIPMALKDRFIPWFAQRPRLSTVVSALVVVVLFVYIGYSLFRPYSGNIVLFLNGIQIESGMG